MSNRGEKAKGQAAGRCIFCDGFGMSKEHIWSDWLSDSGILPRANEHQQFLLTLDMTSPDVVGLHPKMAPKKQGPLIQKKIRKVCQSCNSTWMSGIVEQARPAAEALIREQEFVITPDAQERLSLWIALATIMGEYTHEGSRSISDEERKSLFVSGKLSKYWRILIGRHDATDWLPHRYRHFGGMLGLADSKTRVRLSGPIGTMQVSTYTLGPLAIRAFTCEQPDLLDYHDATAPHQLVQIWPTTEAILWPVEEVIISAEMSQLADDFIYMGMSG